MRIYQIIQNNYMQTNFEMPICSTETFQDFLKNIYTACYASFTHNETRGLLGSQHALRSVLFCSLWILSEHPSEYEILT